MALTALDFGLRGAAVGLALMVFVLLLKEFPFRTLTILRVALTASMIAYAISTAPFFPLGAFGWNAPVVIAFAGVPAIFWLWALAVFNDGFTLRPRHVAIWALVAGLGLFAYCGRATSPILSVTCGRLFALAAIALPILAVTQTQPAWRADLAAGRRRPLIALLLLGTAFSVVNAGAALAAIPWRSISLGFAIGLGVLAFLGVWTSFPQFMSEPALAGAAAIAKTVRRAAARDSMLPADQAALRRLDAMMSVERAYRQDGLTIGLLAARLGLAEQRLRALINEGLGHRNFNTFLNRYRIDEAKSALADPAQTEVPVLTIALDAGFSSITPFNRAFKADTGLTPTEFRRQALAERTPEGGGPPIAPAN